MHVEKQHRTILKFPDCSYERHGGTAKDKYKLKQHILKNHTAKEVVEKIRKSFPCDEPDCTSVFAHFSKFSHHKQTVHLMKTCTECGKQVKNLQLHHKKIHKTDEERSIRCDQCGKGFVFEHILATHRAVVHQGQRFYCRYPGCLKRTQPYRDSSNRDAHERKTHGASFDKAMLIVDASK